MRDSFHRYSAGEIEESREPTERGVGEYLRDPLGDGIFEQVN